MGSKWDGYIIMLGQYQFLSLGAYPSGGKPLTYQNIVYID